MIIVSPLSEAQRLVIDHQVGRVVSLLGPESPHRRFTGVHTDRHLQLTFHDITVPTEGFVAPRPKDTEQIIAFVREWERDAPLLIHCWAGISRSTAAAYVAMCMLRPPGREDEIAWELRHASASATPNRLMVSHADRMLGRNGRMVTAIEAIGRGSDAYEGTPFILKP